MTKRHNVLFLLMGILVLICIGYALFITVFDQIISQNEGFFYALVFGGILILAYLLINIIARLMLIPDKAHYSKALSVVCFVAFIGVCVLFAVSRLTYTSSVSPSEATYYSAGSLINNDALSVSSDLVNKLLNNPAQYVYSLLFSLIYGLLNESSFSLVLINVILCAISSLFAYLLITRFADKLCGLYAAAVVLFLPGQLFCVYSYSTECMFCPIFLATLYFGISVIETKSSALRILFGILYSLFASLLLLAEPVSIIFILLCILGGVFVRKNNALFVVLFSILAIGIFVGLMYLKAGHTGTDFADLLLGTLNCFDNKTVISTGSAATSEDIKTAFNALVSADNRHIENNIYYLTDANGQMPSSLSAAWLMLGNQVAYMFVLILCISSVFFAIVNKDTRLYAFLGAALTIFIILYFEVSRESQGYALRAIMAIISAVGIHYIYLNHHPKEEYAWNKLRGEDSSQPDTDETDLENREDTDSDLQMSEEEFLRRARALVFVNEDEALYNSIKNEEKLNAPIRPDESEIIPEAAAVAEPVAIETAVAESVAIETAVAEPVAIEAAVTEQAAIETAVTEPVAIESVVTEQVAIETVAEEPVTYIDNPLPVPVKKPHSAVDYDYDIDDADDDWDIEVSEEDLKNF